MARSVPAPSVFDMTRRTAALTCPDCPGSPAAVRILFGFPSAEAFEAAKRREVVLGGCMLTEPMPEWACPQCERPLG
jgi:hypothetical protein